MLKTTLTTLFWVILLSFVVLYPMLISIHVYLPLFIGMAGYLLVLGFEGHGMRYVWLSLIYLLNLEANLSLPMFLSLLSVIVFYLTFYEKTRILKRCPICVGLLSVVGINIYYISILVLYDFVFDTTSIMIDTILMYSVLFDLIFVVLI